MSGVFNALTTAVSGINAQSDDFTNLSNNIANSQTTGYKATTTSFSDFVAGNLSSSQSTSGTVKAVSVQHVDNAGTATASTNALALDISGNGMFVTSKPSGSASAKPGQTTFSNQQYYTRNGDFSADKNGYLVNTSGYYLNGYNVAPNGTLNNTLSQLNVANIGFKPTMTTAINVNASVGRIPNDTSNYTPQNYTSATTTTYDNTGNPHKVATQWQESSTNPLVWNLSAYDADGNGSIAQNNYQVTFDSNGALASVKNAQTGQQIGSTLSGSSVEIPITAQYSANSEQTMSLKLGTIGGTSGATMAASTSTASTNQASPLTVSGTSLSMPSSTVMGTTTGSNQNYMSSPVYLGGQTNQDGTVSNQTPLSLKWTQTASSPPTWSVSAVNPYDTSATSAVTSDATHSVVFNSNGTIKSFDGQSVASGQSVNMAANVSGTSYNINVSGASLTTNSTLSSDTSSLTNDSVTSGTYTGAQITSDGSVMAQFDNGSSQLIGKVALANFNNPNGLQAVDGQAYTSTSNSGDAQVSLVGQNGTGTLTPGYTEASTTNLTGDLSALIVAQEAYSANTKTVTTADTMLQQTIAMKQ